MGIYTTLEQVPLPERIYNGPLEEKIVPLVKAVNAQFMCTTGSCEGHIDRFKPYPWVQFVQGFDSRLLIYLVRTYSKRKDIKWVADGNSVRTKNEARNQSELELLQGSIPHFSEFLFQYRPEVLDPSLKKNIFRMPDLKDPEYQRVTREYSETIEEMERLIKQGKNKSENDKIILNKKIERLKELFEMEQNIGEIVIMAPTPEQVNNCLKRVKELLD